MQKILKTLKQQKQLFPLFLLTAFSIHAIISSLLNHYLLTTRNYISFGLILLNYLTYFQLRHYYKYTMTITIVAGLFNVIVFSAGILTAGFGINSLKLSFQVHPFLAGLLTYIINFKRVNEFIIDNLKTKLKPEERERNEKLTFSLGVENFKIKYEKHSVETLTEIIEANKYVPEAIEAARQLLNER